MKGVALGLLWVAAGCVASALLAFGLGTWTGSAAVSLLAPAVVGLLTGWRIGNPLVVFLGYLLPCMAIAFVIAFMFALMHMSTGAHPPDIETGYFVWFPGTLLLAATVGATGSVCARAAIRAGS